MNEKRMIKKQNIGLLWVCMLLCMSGCTAIGDKSASMSVIYGVTTAMSLLLLFGYCGLEKKKYGWFLLLFVSVLVVNVGYFSLSVSRELEGALVANRVAYFGSVFLPLSMLMILLHVMDLKCPKWLVGLLIGLSVVVFVIAASPGYSDIYYKEVTLERINGVAVLQKVYGPLHSLYLFYLLGYFGAMVILVVVGIAKGRMESGLYSGVLVATVFLNIGVWLLEQLVKIDFEFLSISYIISELFLLGLFLLMKENERLRNAIALHTVNCVEQPSGEAAAQKEPLPATVDLLLEQVDMEQYQVGIQKLTATERAVFELYISGRGTKEIMSELNIKENTLKFHNKNIYGKLGVSSRKQLIAAYKHLRRCE